MFEPQLVSRKKNAVDETREKGEWTATKLLDDEVRDRQLTNFRVYAYSLLEFINYRGGEVGLEEFLKHIENKLGYEALYNIDLLPFLLALNIDPIDKSPMDRESAYQTNFDFPKYEDMEYENCELIESSLLWAIKKLGLQGNNLMIESNPESLVKVGKKKSIYVSDMKFILK